MRASQFINEYRDIKNPKFQKWFAGSITEQSINEWSDDYIGYFTFWTNPELEYR